MQQRRDTLSLALNTFAHGTKCFLALVWLLLQAKPVILESCQRWLRDLLPEGGDYLPVPHSASHRLVLDYFSRGVSPYIRLH